MICLMHNKTFRLFISSTFSDFTVEREYMQMKVFPAIESLCASFGYQFQAVDLRWGVDEEAQLDQKTLEICLSEVNACKHHPYPNFLIMIGNRYGWVPLPYAIERTVFEAILYYYSNDKDKLELLREWYQHDLNYIHDVHSTAYVLKPRTGESINYPIWSKIEDSLRTLLQEAVKETDTIAGKEKFFISATEHEVVNGIFSYVHTSGIRRAAHSDVEAIDTEELEYIYGFLREIVRGDPSTDPALWFDSDEKRVKRFRQNLRHLLLKKNLLELTTFQISPGKIDENYIPQFTERLQSFLESSIRKQVDRISGISDEKKIRSEHQAFMAEKLRVFIGREKILGKIDTYITSESTTPFVIYGESGMGKSALMAKAVDNAEKVTGLKVVFRFVGISEDSGEIRSLLLSILKEADISDIDEIERVYNDDIFSELVAKAFSGIREKTVIFIDALDQLPEKSYLKWLPVTLPACLKIIISVLKDKNYEKDSGYLDQLKVLYSDEKHHDNFAELTPLSRHDGEEMLAGLLRGLNRTLTIEQTEYVLNRFERSGYSPLFMTVAIEEVRNWKSFSYDFKSSLNDSVTGGIMTFVQDLTRLYHHQKILVNKVLGYIECSRNGLSEKEILDLLSTDHEVMSVFESHYHRNLSGRIPMAPWIRLYNQISPFLASKVADDVALISMFHRQFRTVIITGIVDGDETRKAIHRKMADYFGKKALVTSEGVINLRKLSEEAFQLFHGGCTQELINLIETGYIKVKHSAGRFYDCLNDIEQAFILISRTSIEYDTYNDRLFNSLLIFFEQYSSENKKLFDFDLIHAYFIYSNRSNFYTKFLEKATIKDHITSFFTDSNTATDYYLIFLTSYVGLLRRKSRLKDAKKHVLDIIAVYSGKITEDEHNVNAVRQLSTAYYELGYISYLTGDFREADNAFISSVSYAQKCDNVVGEWITKCVMKRLAFIGGLTTIDDFNQTLDDAFTVFRKLEATNHAAKRWVMNVLHHKFEIGFLKNDPDMMKHYFGYISTNEWNLEHNVPMEIFEAQIAFARQDYDRAINLYHSYLKIWSENDIKKTEAFADIYWQLGLAYHRRGDQSQAYEYFKKALSLDDEPANHMPKLKVSNFLDQPSY